MTQLQCHSPIDGHLVYATDLHTDDQVRQALLAAGLAQRQWCLTPLAERMGILESATDILFQQRGEIAKELAVQMGRPVRYGALELKGLRDRSLAMLALAERALADIRPETREGRERWISREPLGVVAVLAPWNYPYLTSVNTIIPALAAGNAVILKHAAQTPLVARRYQEAFDAAGLPRGLFQHLYLSHEKAAALVADSAVDFVAFTGSVAGGHAVTRAISEKFIGAGLELGGNDPAYVREDADVEEAAIALADGAFFNSGQSCCGIERIYVHQSLLDEFLGVLKAEAEKLNLGNPLEPATTLGPMVSSKGADAVRNQIADAVAAGATALLPVDDNRGSTYLPPQILTNVNHAMAVMREESFGPVVGVMAVTGDEEAVELMNDSSYGLTASLWTRDTGVAKSLARQLETGTVYMNRCDYLDPDLAWSGVKNSGRGCSLSSLGYEQLTRPKSFNFSLLPEY